MPIGYLIAVAVAAVPVLLAVRPLRRSGRLGRISWLGSMVVNESPFLPSTGSSRRRSSHSSSATSQHQSAGSRSGWPA